MKYNINNIKVIAASLAATLLLGSCNNFLDMENPSSVTTEYYQTYNGQEDLLTSIYSQWRVIYNTGEVQYYGTDLYMAVGETQDEKMFDGYDITFNSTAGIVGDYWTNLYKIVQECNTLIDVCSPEVTGSSYDSFVAQATFMRAAAYYYLVETFGDVPLYMEVQDGIITSATQEDEEVIYEEIIADLSSVLDVLPSRQSVAGYISNTAVEFLVGKLYLTRAYKSYAHSDDFAIAAGYFEKVLSNSDHALLSSYADIFDQSNQNNDEVIWAIQYGEDKNFVGVGNAQHTLFGLNFVGLQATLFSQVQADYSSTAAKYWIIPQVHTLFEDPASDMRYDVTFDREFDINNSAHASYGEPALYFPRWNQSDDNGAVLVYEFQDSDNKYQWMPNASKLGDLAGDGYMPIIQKFKDTVIDWGAAGSREDVVMRVGDAYLLCAEAYFGAGESDKALARIMTIRNRAGAGAINQTFDLDYILDERAREMLGEHDRWFDLKRTRKLISRAKEYNYFVQIYDNLNANHMLRPIPQDEINKVSGLVQNVGY